MLISNFLKELSAVNPLRDFEQQQKFFFINFFKIFLRGKLSQDSSKKIIKVNIIVYLIINYN